VTVKAPVLVLVSWALTVNWSQSPVVAALVKFTVVALAVVPALADWRFNWLSPRMRAEMNDGLMVFPLTVSVPSKVWLEAASQPS
jgi:hypothetical protein